MSRTWKDSKQSNNTNPQRHISVRAVRRDPPDTRRLARALIALVQAQAEADASTSPGTTPDALPWSKDLANRNVDKPVGTDREPHD